MPYFEPDFDETKKELTFTNVPTYARVPIWVPQEGENIIRILPPWNERRKVFKVLALHWFGTKDNRQGVLCLRKFGKKCYICEVIHKLLANKVLSEESIKTYYPKKRAFCNGIDMNNPDEGVKVMALPAEKVAAVLVGFARNPEYGDFTHPEKGYNIHIEKVKSGVFPDYKVFPARKSSPIANKEWLEQLFNLDDFENVWRVHSYEEQKELWEVYSDIIKPVDDDTDENSFGKSKNIDDEDFDVNSLLDE